MNSAAPSRKEENGGMDAFQGKARPLFSDFIYLWIIPCS
jgi:hypothetical protein